MTVCKGLDVLFLDISCHNVSLQKLPDCLVVDVDNLRNVVRVVVVGKIRQGRAMLEKCADLLV